MHSQPFAVAPHRARRHNDRRMYHVSCIMYFSDTSLGGEWGTVKSSVPCEQMDVQRVTTRFCFCSPFRLQWVPPFQDMV